MHVTKRFHPEELELNMTPMIDIVFQLIIFFLVVSEIASNDRIENLVLPAASQAKAEEALPGRLIISVDTSNQIYIAGQPVNMAQVESHLRAEKSLRRRTDQPVLIQADRYAKWEVVQDIIEKASQLKFWKLSFGAKKEGA